MGLATTDTLTNKTLTTPTVSATGFTNATHAHVAANSGGTLGAGAIATGTLTQLVGGTGAGALTCSAGQALTSNGTAQSCTATLTASDVVCAGTCVADAEIVGMATTKLSGTITNAQLASTYSGAGACGANTFASTLNGNAAPTCTQPAFANLSGVATTAQIPTVTVPKGGSNLTTVAANQVYVGTAADTFTAKTIPSCSNATTEKLLYNSGTQTWTCGTDQTSAGGGYATVQDEGSALTARTVVNFIGAGVTCVDNGGATRTDCTIPGGSGSPGGSTGDVQYNNAGAFAGASNVTIGPAGNLTLLEVGSTPSAPATGVRLYGVRKAGRVLPNFQGPSGLDSPIQPAWFANSIAMWLPGTTTAVTAIGMPGTVTVTGSNPAITTTDLWSSIKRWRAATSTVAGNVAGVRSGVDVVWRGNAAGRGGWFMAFRGTANLITAQGRAFVGFKDALTVLGNVNPSTNLDTAYFGFDSTQTTWRFCTNDNSGSATCTDLGANFPNNLSSDGFEFRMFAKPNDAEIFYYAERLGTGATASGSVTTKLPRNTVQLAAEVAVCNGTDVLANNIEMNRFYVESDL